MTEGWTCPACKRGVAPGEKTCDHGASAAPIYGPNIWPMTASPYRSDCPACRAGGLCNCYRPGRWIIDGPATMSGGMPGALS